MILPTHDLWGHVPRSTTRICIVVRFNYASDTQICEAKVAFLIKNKILWFDVPVDYVVQVKEL